MEGGLKTTELGRNRKKQNQNKDEHVLRTNAYALKTDRWIRSLLTGNRLKGTIPAHFVAQDFSDSTIFLSQTLVKTHITHITLTHTHAPLRTLVSQRLNHLISAHTLMRKCCHQQDFC